MYVLFIMVAVGALIGGITNSIAIKMLFRPYRAIYVGRIRLPFTPGLIPKRREELAKQLGKLVVNHLLTVEGLKKKLESSIFISEMTDWLNREIKGLLRSEENISSILEKWFGVSGGKQIIELQLENWLTSRSDELLEELRPQYIKDIIPEALDEKIELYIPKLTTIFVEKGKDYFNSDEGVERLSHMVDRFLIGKGTLGSMLSMFISRDQLVLKLQPEMVKMLTDKGTHEMIEDFIRKEWTTLKEFKIEEIEKHINLTGLVVWTKEKIKENIPTYFLEMPLYKWMNKYDIVIYQIIPYLVQNGQTAISRELATFLTKLKLEDVVKNEVEQFPVMRLEEMILSISKREFKLITYLGALLGGFIGLLQGIFLVFLQ
ncbi:hypothetical protein BKP45_00965 [Anaerobacillus alkalidiazotrophicus]|uniref:DUF445 domain-containing protein n=1 Tax=Anaerobacillus alkalidiazotrophicus TaxID=472963 RepID=A0A1S2M9J2_9BACI|nr:DUF445 family protein [Anaerobacillus alkalidiazotrophicus]OIJ21381.1 hypothetical protein BKP45_00965 [Anaerobacillus alkalidiazotrophicus]